MGKNKKDPNRPRGRMSAYAYFVQDRRSKAEGQVNFTAFSKDCADKWRGMSDGEKRPYNDKSATDKLRYDREMSSYIPPMKDKNSKSGRRRAKKDPDAPKRNLSAFFLFSRDERGAIKNAHKDWSVGKIAQQLAKIWKTVPLETKEKYDAEAARDKERYLKEMAIFKETKPKAPRKPQRKESTSSSSSDDSSSDDSSSDSDSDEE
ncbi:high mobility group protein 1 homolog [Lytechinus variegatus]|uniref:high mobility group protein 1 homolog n=1 Tax=Lytechinus variegatus TaxID=7654 RepID=UPI001BB27BF9|nr:high mobility group protein 1 homolog [Lytechinus variegatus]